MTAHDERDRICKHLATEAAVVSNDYRRRHTFPFQPLRGCFSNARDVINRKIPGDDSAPAVSAEFDGCHPVSFWWMQKYRSLMLKDSPNVCLADYVA
jgi:hypothetical protein